MQAIYYELLPDLDPRFTFPRPGHFPPSFHHCRAPLKRFIGRKAGDIVRCPPRPPERLEIVLGPLLTGRPRVGLEPEHAAAHKRVLQFGVGVLGGVPFHEAQDMKGVFRGHNVHAGSQACRRNVAAFHGVDGPASAFPFRASLNGPHNVLVAASRQPGKVEGTDDIAGYAALREPYQEWGPMLGNGAAADVVQFIKDVGASVQDAGKDQLLR